MTNLTCTFNSNQHIQLTPLPAGSLISQSPALLSHFLYAFLPNQDGMDLSQWASPLPLPHSQPGEASIDGSQHWQEWLGAKQLLETSSRP